MKSNLIKFGLVCTLSAFVLTACVKKEESTQNQDEQQEQSIENVQNTPETTEVEAPEAVVLTEEVMTIEPSDLEDTTASESQNNAPAPAVQREVREQTAAVSEPKPAEKPAQPAVPATAPKASSSNEAATIDDAVAEAMRAAQPALEQ